MRAAAPHLANGSGLFRRAILARGVAATQRPPFGLRDFRQSFTGGFTLMEIMIVVGIMAIVMATGLPLVMKARKREPLHQSVRDVMEVLSNARAMAILQGKMTEVIIDPEARSFQVAGIPSAAPREASAEVTGFVDPSAPPPPTDSGLNAVLGASVNIEMLDVNLIEYKDQDSARVRFHPNGTCDEFTLVLHSDRGDWIKIWTEITTSLAFVGPVDAK